MKNKRRRKQYHPAVCAGLHIAFEEYSHYLSFEEEHRLGTGSKSVDCLILKKDKGIKIKKDIGRIFRGHNLIEIKGFGDYLSIDKFYQAFGYALFYKADTEREGSIDIQDITLTFIISSGLPKKVIRHLEKCWGIKVTREAGGIYYLRGLVIPMQILIVSELGEEENLLLKGLLIPLKTREKVDRLLETYQQYEGNGFYEKAIKFIIEKEREYFREEENMDQELKDLIWDVYQKPIRRMAMDLARDEVKGMAEDLAKGMAEDIARDMAKGMAEDMAEDIARDMAKGMAEDMARDIAEEKVSEIEKQITNQKTDELAVKLLKKGMSCEEVSEYMELTVERVRDLEKGLLQAL